MGITKKVQIALIVAAGLATAAFVGSCMLLEAWMISHTPLERLEIISKLLDVAAVLAKIFVFCVFWFFLYWMFDSSSVRRHVHKWFAKREQR